MTTKLSARPSNSMLESLGYEVITGGERGRGHIHSWRITRRSLLLFTDVVMPGAINGRTLAERAVEINPEIKILFTSGYTENSIVHNSRLDPGVEFLSKPYDRERLAMKGSPRARRTGQKTEGCEPSGTGGATMSANVHLLFGK